MFIDFTGFRVNWCMHKNWPLFIHKYPYCSYLYLLKTPYGSDMVYSESLNGRMYIRGKSLSKGCVTITSHLKQEGAYETTGELRRGAKGRVANILKIDKNCVSRHNKWLTNKNRRSLPKGGSEKSLGADDVSICMLQYPMHFSSFYLPVFYISKPSTSAINQPWNSLKRRFAFNDLPGQSTTARAEHLLRQQRTTDLTSDFVLLHCNLLY